MLARLDLCKDKGFDGVLLDNIDNYLQKTGFPLSGVDQLRYVVWIANEARTRGLAVGINNNPRQALQLLPYFDWALAESCFSQGWCASLRPVAEAGKPVVVVEYTDDQAKVNAAKVNAMCKEASTLQFTFMVKKRELDAYRYDCRSGDENRALPL
jgi:endo-alpha-1,4-polygalactosaminidase (GH114 family)